ncbi:hypothetical protein Cri9333_2507 [Crinalium epipsammum PCC 9333]|uniref:Glycoside hydrolase family 13 N-terminal domain-containing protein n=1 Tax=Crinalium epipsammum PCC 9333 TaxID=1173022 RepID=K9VZ13_9CYAN|nr:hypothetical protein [Crinalium epipsammum]AFZ13373.1 hypothetical protein Cri9333_2507 [Crinalium epipsammum PCC 9333]
MASSIEFNLFAPNNKAAGLRGYFSEWKEIFMRKCDDHYFRTNIELEDGVYPYKFRVQSKSPSFELDQWVEVVAPYATDVDDRNNVAIAHIKNGKFLIQIYICQHDDQPLPANHHLVIYEMHVSDFRGR